MDLNYDTFIKQEFLNAEEHLMQKLPNTDLNISIKNEAISDEISPFVTIKNEPLNEPSTFLEGAAIVKNENQFQNQLSIPGDSFIIYELETPPSMQPALSTQTLQNDKQITKESTQSAPQISVTSNFQFNQNIINTNPQVNTLNHNPITNNKNNITTTAPISSAPPILLNAKLRKRNKVVIPVNPIDKRTRYNIEGTTTVTAHKQSSTVDVNNPPKTLNSSFSLNTGNKKIINHLIKRKSIQRKQEESSLTNSDNILNTEMIEKSNVVTIKEPSLSPTSLPHIEQINSAIPTEFNLKVSSPSSSKTDETTFKPISLPQLDQIKPTTQTQLNLRLSSPPLKLENDSPTVSIETKDPPFTSELRVKCLCSLTAHNSDITEKDNSDLRAFFKEMFEETRRLNKKQQRKVKMSLLQAISEAEELVEQGKCCGF